MSRLFLFTFENKITTIMECLKEIIGVVSADCPCLTDGIPEEQISALTASKSELFIDDLEGGVSMRALTSLDACKSFAIMALGARDSAIKTMEADVLAALALKYKSGKNPFVGAIGRPSYTRTLPINRPYQFLRLKPQRQSDAVLSLTGLRVIVNQDDRLHVRIIRAIQDGNQGDVIYETSVDAAAGMYASVPLTNDKLLLPLAANGETLEYYFVWSGEKPTTAAKDLKADCNCGFNKAGFTDYVEAKGGELDSLDNLQAAARDVYTHGFSLDVDIRCVPGDLICREYDRENAISLTMAYAARYKAGELLIEKVMSASEVNRYTMMNREYLWGKRNHFKKEYETRITYLASVMDVTSSDCFICRETRMFKALIN